MIRCMTFVLATALVVPAMAQNAATTNMEILRQKIKADKRLVVAQNLNLTDAEGAKFWPVYEAYQKDRSRLTNGSPRRSWRTPTRITKDQLQMKLRRSCWTSISPSMTPRRS